MLSDHLSDNPTTVDGVPNTRIIAITRFTHPLVRGMVDNAATCTPEVSACCIFGPGNGLSVGVVSLPDLIYLATSSSKGTELRHISGFVRPVLSSLC